MRVLFIYPNLNAQIGFNYGIAHMSALLKQHGIETHLLNINEQVHYPLDLQRIKKDVKRINPDVIGFSVVTNQYKYAVEVAHSIKTYLSRPIMFGGIHPTMDPFAVMQDEAVDSICVGEGEEAFLEFLTKGSPQGVRNLGYRDGQKIVLEPLRPYTDLARLPFKDYDIFDFQTMIDAKDGWVGLLTGRGCPFRCTYCLNHKIIKLYKNSGHLPKSYMRRHSVDEVIHEIDYLLTHYKRIKMFIFDDDVFTLDKRWLQEFSDKYKRLTNTGFVCNAHVRFFDEEVAAGLKGAGCRIIKFGLESGSDSLRRNVLHRFMTNNDIEKAFAAAHKYGLHTSAFVMIGLPCESKDDSMATIKLLARIKPGRFRWSLFFPYVGTEAYEIAKAKGAIDFEKMKTLDNFTDETCMDLGEEVNLLVDKVQNYFCTFVNGYGNMAGREGYRELVDRIEAAERSGWEAEKKGFAAEIAEMDRQVAGRGELHYTVKFNRFMGVRSDWKDDSLSA
jgi:anaerobic magnesium-protoporphyrin IX monomethyl ester cyclase